MIQCLSHRGAVTYPFQTRGETSTTSATQTGCLDLRDDLCWVSYVLSRCLSCTHPVIALQEDLLGLVPVSVLHRALQVGSVVAVQVLEDAILVLEPAVCPLGRGIVYCGQGALLLL